MKKIVLTLGLSIATFLNVSAQFNVETHAGDPILDGDVVSFNQHTVEDAQLKFYVNNESTTDPINMKIEFVSAVNYTGVGMQLCFGLCYDPITEGATYPPGNDPIIIQPGQNQGIDGDKFWNFSDGGGSSIQYVFRFFQVDGTGNEIGEDLTFTYNFDPTLSVNEQSQVNARILSTIVTSDLVIEATENTKLQVYDILGSVVLSKNLTTGSNLINVSALPSQLYIVQLTNDRGVSQAIKIVKR